MSSNRRAFQAQLPPRTLPGPQETPQEASQEVLEKFVFFSKKKFAMADWPELSRRPPRALRARGGRLAEAKRCLTRYTVYL